MNEIRRTILWVIFGFSMVLLWDQWQIHNGKKPTFFPQPTAPQTAPAAPATPGGATPSAATPVPVAAVPTAAAPAAPAAAPPTGASVGAPQRERINIKTDVLELTFDTEGGSLVKSVFSRYADLQSPGNNFVLFDESKDRVYLAHTGLIGAPGTGLPNHKTVMTAAPGPRELAPGQDQLELRFESPEVGGVKLAKTYLLKRGSYVVNVRHELTNTGTAPVNPQLYFQLVRDGNKPAGESAFYYTFTGPAVYTEAKKFQKIEFSDIEKNKFEAEKQADSGYIAMVQHYFASAWLLPQGQNRDIFLRKVDNNLYAVGLIAPLAALAPGAKQSFESQLFVGPQEEKQLEALAPGLELVKDYGWFTILAKPLYWLLYELHRFIGNWGWAIVALVFLIKLAFYWLNAKAYQSMAKMKAINPRIMELRDRLKDKPQEMQMAMMNLYKQEKVNPMGGCFPIMVQIPVFIALYWVLLSSVEMRNAPWVGWIADLSAPDPYFILPILMTLTTLLQTALNPLPPDPLQAKLMWLMPLIFSVMFFFFPAGLVLYWITNNILSIAQQWVINTRMGVPPQFNLPKFK
jgi:YidC/Oxa1 family membrane protein insertase